MNHADRIAIGTAVLTRRALGDSARSVAVRGGVAALVSPYVVVELHDYPLVVPAALVAGLGAAWWAARPKAAEDEAVEQAGEETADAEQALALDEFAAHVRACADGAHGAHLAALAERLTEETKRPWDAAAVRAHCRALAVPVSGSVRHGPRGVSTGVRVKDLPESLPDPVVAVVGAGQDTPTEAATATATGPELQLTVEQGAGMTIIRDPSERRAYKV
jgi:hypothetical protein